MAISFNHPVLLLLLPLVLYPVYLWYRDSLHLPPFRRKAAFGLRSLLLLSLLLALAGLEMHFYLNNQSVVFLADLSASCENTRDKMESFIQEALKQKKADDRFAVVAFGGNAQVDQILSNNMEFVTIESLIDRNFTNPEQALKLADGLLPEESCKRVVLMSDGRQNEGDVLKEVEYLAGKNIRVDILPLETSSGPDIKINSLHIPQKLFAREKFPIKLTLESNTAAEGKLRIYRNHELIIEEETNLNKGENQLVYSSLIEESGFYSFKAHIEVINDSVAENNEASAFTQVQGIPRVLIVEGSAGEGRALLSVLDSLQLPSDVVSPGEVPKTLPELQRYGVIILCNVAAEALSRQSMDAIHAAVRDLGKGLIMTGGEDSFGPGGYFNTPIEQALPVYMDLRGKKEIPSLGLVLVIDKSGSMSDGAGGYSRIELAKEAAIEATTILGPLDKIGVIAFDDTSQWVVELQSVTDLEAIQDDIATIRAGGGTSIYPAIALAYSALKDVKTKYKHVILLTDGQSASTGDYYFLARRMEKAGITMSTVAVGEGADTLLLEQLADWGGGRYYYSDEIDNIPRIFTKETMKAIKSYLVEESFYPLLTSHSPVMEGIDKVPALEGYVAASAKNTAQTILSSHREDPVLAQWQYGLGRSIAFTSDVKGHWSSSWLNWSGYNRFWGNLVSWTLPRGNQDNLLNLQARVEGSQGLIQLDSREFTASLPSEAIIVNPDLGRQEIKLEAVAPGKYEGRFTAREPGVYLIKVSQQGPEGELRTASGGLALSYSPEYSYHGTDRQFLQRLAEAGGGSIISEPQEAFADNLAPATGVRELWPWLLILAAIILPLDIANRRLAYDISGIKSWWNRSYKKVMTEPDSDTQPGLNRLRDRKEELKDWQRQKFEGSTVVDKPRHSEVQQKSKHAAQDSKQKETETPKEADKMSRLLAAKNRAARK